MNQQDMTEQKETMMNIATIRMALDEAELLTQLAEEAAELSQAALKYRRALTGDNPTPVTMEEARKNLLEEIRDVNVVISVIGRDLHEPLDVMSARADEKIKRWGTRLREKSLASQESTYPGMA